MTTTTCIARWVRLALAVAIGVLGSIITAPFGGSVAFAATPNPDLPASCGIDVVLVLDESGSIESAGAVGQVEDSVRALIRGLKGTGSRVRIVEFSTNARGASVGGTTAFQTVDGALETAVETYLTGHAGTVTAQTSTSYNPGYGQLYTNWEAGLYQASLNPGDLVVFVTDGQPNTVGTAGTSNGGAASASAAAAAAANELDAIKGGGTHVLGIGVGAASNTTNFNLLANTIEPTKTPDAWLGTGSLDIRTVDAMRVSTFDALDDALRLVVFALCAPSVSITKVDGAGRPIPAWDFTATVDVAAGASEPGTYEWVSPLLGVTTDDGAGNDAGQTVSTNGTGTALFQWTPGSVASPATYLSTFRFSETLAGGWVVAADQPDCNVERLNPDGTTASFQLQVGVTRDAPVASFTLLQGGTEFSLNPADIVTCTIVNDLLPAPRVVKGAVEGNDNLATLAEPGGSVVIPVTVHNDAAGASGDATLTALVDDVHGDITTTGHDGITATTCSIPQPVPAGASYSCTFTIDSSSQPGTVTDTVTATLTNEAAPDGVTDTDQANVVITDVVPDIAVSKTANPTEVPETGGDVEFTYTVANESIEAVTITVLSDDRFGPLAGDADCQVGTVLPAGGSCSFSATFAVPAGDVPGTHVNVFSATAVDDDGSSGTATDDETVTYTDVLSDVSVTKTADPTSVPEPGADVSFTIVVDNLSAVDSVTIDTLDDSIYGDLNGQGDCTVPQTIVAGGSYSCSFTGFVGANAGDVHTNVVTASGVDDDGHPVSDTDDATVTVIDVPSSIVVEKTADPTSVDEPGGFVTFTFTVTNTSPVDTVTIGSLTDSIYGDLHDQGDCSVPQALAAAGGSYSCSFTVFVGGNAGDVHTNVVTASGVDDDGNPVSDDDDARVAIVDVLPDITVEKTAGASSIPEPGADVTFTFVVTNVNSETVTLDSLVDSVFGDLNGQGDCVTGGVIAGDGGTFSCSLTTFVAGNAGDVHTNVVTAVASDDDGNTDEATDDASVDITDVPSEIDVRKTADPSSVPETGGDVTFTFTVHNLSPVDTVTIDSLVDSIYGDLNGQGDCSVPQVLAAGDDSTCSITVFVGGNAGDVHTNVVTASGVDDDGNPVSDEDDASVTLTDVLPDITVEKTADPVEVLEPGGDVTFTFVVTNVNSEAVTLDSLVDSVFGDLNGQGDCVTGGVIAGDGGTFSCSLTTFIAGNAGDVHTNVVTAVASDDDGNTDEATDDATVDITDVLSLISVTKTADPTVVPEPGGDVTFTFVVTNLSEVDTVTIESLVDSIYGDLNGQGDCTVPQELAPGDDSTCSITVFVGGNAGDVHTNVVTASGVDDDGNPLEASDDAVVSVSDVPSSIRTIKQASPASVPETGGDVTYTVTVTNISAVDTVTIETVVDDVFGDVSTSCAPALPAALAPGESITCTFVEFIVGDAGDVHTNVVTASGVDDDGHPVSDDDDADVVLVDVLPDITVVKTADPVSVPEPGGDVTFTFVVTNHDSEPVTLDSLVDSVFGDLNGQGDCAVPQELDADGGTYSCTLTVFVAGDAGDTHLNVVTATAYDDDENQDVATDDARVDIDDVPSSIEIVKTAEPTSVAEPGGDVTFTFTVSNTSQVDTITVLTLVDSVFGNLDGQGDCSVPQVLEPGESYSCAIVEFVAGDAGDVHTNVATVSGIDDDGTPVGDQDGEEVPVTDVPSEIRVTKSASPTSVPEPGADVTFTFVVENLSAVDVVTITSITDSVFGDLDGEGTCSVPQVIAAGGSYTCEITELVGGVEGVVHRNVVTVTGTDDDGVTVTDDDAAEVRIDAPLAADLAIVKTASVATVRAGSSYDWILDVTNLGPDIAAENVVVSDTVPGPGTVVSVSSDGFDCSADGNVVTCTAPSMPVGATWRITIRVAVPSDALSTTVTNLASVDSDTPDDDLINNSDEETVEVEQVEQEPPPEPPPVTLPPTGGTTRQPLTIASWLVLAGLGLVLAAVRRRGRPASA